MINFTTRDYLALSVSILLFSCSDSTPKTDRTSQPGTPTPVANQGSGNAADANAAGGNPVDDLGPPAATQDVALRFVVTGQVTAEDGSVKDPIPLGGVTINVPEVTFSGETDAAGVLSAPINLSSNIDIEFSKDGYEDSSLLDHDVSTGVVEMILVATGSDSSSTSPTDPVNAAVVSLFDGTHDSSECTANGGELVGTGDEKFCKMSASNCPYGWRYYLNWSETTTPQASSVDYFTAAYDDDTGQCQPGGKIGTLSIEIADTHAWANTVPEVKSETSLTCTGGSTPISTIVSIRAIVTKVGCY